MTHTIKLKNMVDIDNLNICPIALDDINLADINQAKKLQKQNKHLSFLAIILSLTVFGLLYYHSIKETSAKNYQALAEPKENF